MATVNFQCFIPNPSFGICVLEGKDNFHWCDGWDCETPEGYKTDNKIVCLCDHDCCGICGGEIPECDLGIHAPKPEA